MSRPKAALRAPARTSGFRSAGPNISSSRRTRAAGGSASRSIDLWQLHRIDSKVPANEQFDAIKSLIRDRVIRCAGLSEVSVAEIEAASKFFPVATVQNRYNFADRASEAALDYCAKNRHRLHPVVPAQRRRTRARRLGARRDRPQAQGEPRPDRARLAPEAQPGHAADPRHRQGRASRGERRRGGDQAHPTRSLRRSTRSGARRADLRARSTNPGDGCVGNGLRVYTRMASVCYCSSLRAAARKTTALYDAALAPVGINVAQFGLLRRIERAQPCR